MKGSKKRYQLHHVHYNLTYNYNVYSLVFRSASSRFGRCYCQVHLFAQNGKATRYMFVLVFAAIRSV